MVNSRKFALAGATLLLLITPSLADERVIDWTKCKQPDLKSEAHQKAVTALVTKYMELAKKDRPGKHVAVQLNRVYVERMIPDRRAIVDKSYIPIGPKRTPEQCALSQKDYERLIASRDASYQIMCRGEVAAGKDVEEREKFDFRALVLSAGYDFLKEMGWDPQAKKGEPTTPAGGRAACAIGRELAIKDPYPKAADLAEFNSHMSWEKVKALKLDQD